MATLADEIIPEIEEETEHWKLRFALAQKMVGLSNEDARLIISLEDQKAEEINAFKQECEQNNTALGRTKIELFADEIVTVKKYSAAIHSTLDSQLRCLDTAQAGSAISRMTIVEHNLETNTSPPETGSGETIQYSEVVKSYIELLKDLAAKQKHSVVLWLDGEELILEHNKRQKSDRKKIKDLTERRLTREAGVIQYNVQALAKFRELKNEIATSTSPVETKEKLLEVEQQLAEQLKFHVNAVGTLIEGADSSVLKDLLASLLTVIA